MRRFLGPASLTLVLLLCYEKLLREEIYPPLSPAAWWAEVNRPGGGEESVLGDDLARAIRFVREEAPEATYMLSPKLLPEVYVAQRFFEGAWPKRRDPASLLRVGRPGTGPAQCSSVWKGKEYEVVRCRRG